MIAVITGNDAKQRDGCPMFMVLNPYQGDHSFDPFFQTI